MVKPNLLQSLTQKPTRSYNSGENSFYSPATDPYRRRPKTRSESGGDDTSSLRSLRSSSSIGDASSIRSSRSVGYNKGRPSKYSWSSTTLNEEPLPKTSRHYGNYLAERDRQSLIVRQPSVSSTAERKRKESGERMKAASVPNLASGYNVAPKEIPSELPPPASQQSNTSVQHRRTQSAQSPGSARRLRSLTRVQEEEEERPPVPQMSSIMQNGHQRPPLHQTPSQRLAEEARAASQNNPPRANGKSSSEALPILSPLSPRDYSQPFVLLKFELVLAESYVFSGKVTGKQDNRSPHVIMRLSRNRWATHEDHTAMVTAVPFSNDADFSVIVHANAGDHLEFALRMYMGTEEAWDSDGGKNFAIVLPRLHSRNASPITHSTPPMTHQRNISKHKPQASEGSESFVSASEGDYEDDRRSRAWVDSLPGRHLADPIERPLSASASSSASSWDRQTATTTPNGSDSALAQQHPHHPAKYASALPPRIFLTRTESDRANLSSATHGEELANTPPAKAVEHQPYFPETERPISGLPEYMRQSAIPARQSTESFRSAASVYSGDGPHSTNEIRYGLVKDETAEAEAMPAPISLPGVYGPPPPLVPSAPVSRASSMKSESRSAEHRNEEKRVSPARSVNEVPFPTTAQPSPSMMNDNVAGLGQLFQPNDFAPPRRRGSLDSHSIRSDYGPPSRRYSSLHGRESSVTTMPRPKAASLMNAPVGSLSVSQRSTPVKAIWTTAHLSNPSNTMCAIAIAAGAAAAFSKRKATKTRFFGGKRKPATALAGDLSDVRFTEIAELPSKPKGTEVLVQVWATALDFWDAARVETLVKRGDGFAFVPGRSFCGKVVDTGFDETKFKRGDVVYGLADIKKSGALAELLLIDRRALSKAPDSALSIEQMAAVPLAGVPAFYAMSTLAADLPQAAKLLVLNAHAGAGFIAIQLARHLRPDLHVTAHVAADTLDAEALCKSNGAHAVIRDEPIVGIGRLTENSFSVVLDTIGGQRIYDASRRILHDEGVFVSLVGDDLSPVTVGKQWKASFRSLKRAFTKKDKKSISYFLPIMTGEDHREALDALRDLVEKKRDSLTPNVKRVLRFENGEEAFKEEQQLLGGTVIRINEV